MRSGTNLHWVKRVLALFSKKRRREYDLTTISGQDYDSPPPDVTSRANFRHNGQSVDSALQKYVDRFLPHRQTLMFAMDSKTLTSFPRLQRNVIGKTTYLPAKNELGGVSRSLGIYGLSHTFRMCRESFSYNVLACESSPLLSVLSKFSDHVT